MTISLIHLIKELQQVRKQKGLSQRDLGAKVGLPQSHVSKIERGLVDFQTSSLIELGRVLDREVMLIPRPLISTIQNLISQYGEPATEPSSTEPSLDQPLYRLDRGGGHE